MAIPNYSKYSITAHCKEQLINRFNLAENDITKWIQRYMTQARFEESQADNRQKWRKGDIVMILDIRQKNIVTVYNKSPKEEDVGGKPLNPELSSEVKSFLENYSSKKKRELGAKIVDELHNMYEYSSKMVDKRTNFRYSDNLYDSLITTFLNITQEVNKTQDLLNEVENFGNNLHTN